MVNRGVRKCWQAPRMVNRGVRKCWQARTFRKRLRRLNQDSRSPTNMKRGHEHTGSDQPAKRARTWQPNPNDIIGLFRPDLERLLNLAPEPQRFVPKDCSVCRRPCRANKRAISHGLLPHHYIRWAVHQDYFTCAPCGNIVFCCYHCVQRHRVTVHPTLPTTFTVRPLPPIPLYPGFIHNPVDTCIVVEVLPEGEADGW